MQCNPSSTGTPITPSSQLTPKSTRPARSVRTFKYFRSRRHTTSLFGTEAQSQPRGDGSLRPRPVQPFKPLSEGAGRARRGLGHQGVKIDVGPNLHGLRRNNEQKPSRLTLLVRGDSIFVSPPKLLATIRPVPANQQDRFRPLAFSLTTVEDRACRTHRVHDRAHHACCRVDSQFPGSRNHLVLELALRGRGVLTGRDAFRRIRQLLKSFSMLADSVSSKRCPSRLDRRRHLHKA